ncbi:hypothetical protein [Phytoactinopolyspora mesophila]|uniref:Uncharacterized protein n=1 Tax=Phytoactinopolyspora mesophila TaxID=2650750 RepID=A0A7K3M9D6_9ACTN|nr:hypothetical protein [Phytoactinopolyspora mesophila]NDL59028.1 hypothetical protein [Phytoactinopolyspora mesophila]
MGGKYKGQHPERNIENEAPAPVASRPADETPAEEAKGRRVPTDIKEGTEKLKDDNPR